MRDESCLSFLFPADGDIVYASPIHRSLSDLTPALIVAVHGPRGCDAHGNRRFWSGFQLHLEETGPNETPIRQKVFSQSDLQSSPIKIRCLNGRSVLFVPMDTDNLTIGAAAFTFSSVHSECKSSKVKVRSLLLSNHLVLGFGINHETALALHENGRVLVNLELEKLFGVRYFEMPWSDLASLAIQFRVAINVLFRAASRACCRVDTVAIATAATEHGSTHGGVRMRGVYEASQNANILAVLQQLVLVCMCDMYTHTSTQISHTYVHAGELPPHTICATSHLPCHFRLL